MTTVIPTFSQHTQTRDAFGFKAGAKHADHFLSYLTQNLVQHSVLADENAGSMTCVVFALCSYEPVWVGWCHVAWIISKLQHVHPDSLYRPRILQFSALANIFPQ